MKLFAGKRIDGIDVSHWQGNIVWKNVPNMMVMVAKATHGAYKVDKTFKRNWKGMAGRCQFRGAYHFLTEDDPQMQAEHFYNTVGPLQPGDFIVIDVEPAGTTPILPTKHVVSAMKHMEQLFGVPVVVYIGAFYPGVKAIIGKRAWWLPAYTTRRKAKGLAARIGKPVVAWQWGGGAEGVYVTGIRDGKSRVDANEVWDTELLAKVSVPR